MFVPSSHSTAALGLLLSLYALYVEHKTASIKDDPTEEFVALCDIKALGASCSSVFQLPEGHLLSYIGLIPAGHTLDVPNAMLGAIYYFYRLVLDEIFPIAFSQLAAVAALASSVFLAYKLTILGELCILCWTTHALNLFLLIDALVTLPKRLKPKMD